MRGPTGTRQPGVGWGATNRCPPPPQLPPGSPPRAAASPAPRPAFPCLTAYANNLVPALPALSQQLLKPPGCRRNPPARAPRRDPRGSWRCGCGSTDYYFFFKKRRSFQGIVRNPSWRSGREPRSPAQSGARVHRPNESRGYVGGERVGGPTPRDLPPPARERLLAASARLSPPPPSGPTRGRRRLAPARAPPVTSPCSLLKCTT